MPRSSPKPFVATALPVLHLYSEDGEKTIMPGAEHALQIPVFNTLTRFMHHLESLGLDRDHIELDANTSEAAWEAGSRLLPDGDWSLDRDVVAINSCVPSTTGTSGWVPCSGLGATPYGFRVLLDSASAVTAPVFEQSFPKPFVQINMELVLMLQVRNNPEAVLAGKGMP